MNYSEELYNVQTSIYLYVRRHITNANTIIKSITTQKKTIT